MAMVAMAAVVEVAAVVAGLVWPRGGIGGSGGVVQLCHGGVIRSSGGNGSSGGIGSLGGTGGHGGLVGVVVW